MVVALYIKGQDRPDFGQAVMVPLPANQLTVNALMASADDQITMSGHIISEHAKAMDADRKLSELALFFVGVVAFGEDGTYGNYSTLWTARHDVPQPNSSNTQTLEVVVNGTKGKIEFLAAPAILARCLLMQHAQQVADLSKKLVLQTTAFAALDKAMHAAHAAAEKEIETTSATGKIYLDAYLEAAKVIQTETNKLPKHK